MKLSAVKKLFKKGRKEKENWISISLITCSLSTWLQQKVYKRLFLFLEMPLSQQFCYKRIFLAVKWLEEREEKELVSKFSLRERDRQIDRRTERREKEREERHKERENWLANFLLCCSYSLFFLRSRTAVSSRLFMVEHLNLAIETNE